MSTPLNRPGQFEEGKVARRSKLQAFRNWLQPLLLVPLLSVSPIGYAGAIHDAAKSGDLDQIQKLVVQGADVNAKTARDETPLILASLAGNGEIVNYLLQRGADIKARNSSGMTALHAAAYTGHSEIVTLLVAKGANVNDASNRFKTTALHLASEENHLETVRTLLGLGADFTALEINSYSAMTQAGWREHWGVLELLLANGDVCQGVEIAGDWLYGECTTRANAN